MSGPFSRQTITQVASVVSNLAGNVEDRPDFLKRVAMGAILSGKNVGESLIKSYLTGPGITLKNFDKWADNSGYIDYMGLTGSGLFYTGQVDTSAISIYLSGYFGKEVSIINTEVGLGNAGYFIDQYVANNYPSLLGDDYKAEIDNVTKEVTLTFSDATVVTWPIYFDTSRRYLYITYQYKEAAIDEPIDVGALVTLDSFTPFPELTDWEELTNVDTTVPVTLSTKTETLVTYSDLRPDEYSDLSTDNISSYTNNESSYLKEERQVPPVGRDLIKSLFTTRYMYTSWEVIPYENTTTYTEDIGGGVTKTTVVTITTDTLVSTRSYRDDTQMRSFAEWSSPKIQIEIESEYMHPVYADIFNPISDFSNFAPFIPIRLNNQDVKDNYPEEVYERSKKALKKALDVDYDDIRATLNDNPSINDIDFAYVTLGVPLSTPDNLAKRYIYEFFKRINDQAYLTGEAEYLAWVLEWENVESSWDSWLEWKKNVNNLTYSAWKNLEPIKRPYPKMPRNTLQIATTNPTLWYNTSISWGFTKEYIGSGLLEPTAKAGDYWITYEAGDQYKEQVWVQKLTDITDFDDYEVIDVKLDNVDNIYINWQVSNSQWRRIRVCGLLHTNTIYRGKAVYTTAQEAVTGKDMYGVPISTDPNYESPFIIPLHLATFNSLPLKVRTQLACTCAYLLINCYDSEKQEWYETEAFKAFVYMVTAYLTLVGLPQFLAGAGVFGTAAQAGLMIGLRGVLGIFLGYILNYLAAYLIMKVLIDAASNILGDELGLVIGTILGIVTLQTLTNISGGSSFFESLSSFSKADNLIMLSLATGNAYSESVSIETARMNDQFQYFNQEYSTIMGEIDKRLGDSGNTGILSTQEMTNALLLSFEHQDAFLQRTLLVGSDIASITQNLITNFVELTTSLDLP